MCTWCAYMSFTEYSPLHEKKDTSQTLRKNTWRLHGITCRLTSSCKVHFAGKYPYLHVYNIHCRKKKVHFASATQKTCNIVHATHHFLIEWVVVLTEWLPRNDARMWWSVCTLSAYVSFTQYSFLHEEKLSQNKTSWTHILQNNYISELIAEKTHDSSTGPRAAERRGEQNTLCRWASLLPHL